VIGGIDKQEAARREAGQLRPGEVRAADAPQLLAVLKAKLDEERARQTAG
jgi:hypothetical protein